MMLRKVLSKYQITLPKEAVKMLNIRQGDLVQCEVKKNRIILSPVQVSPRDKGLAVLDQVSRKWERLGITEKETRAAVSVVRDQQLSMPGELKAVSGLKKRILSAGGNKIRRIVLYGSRARGDSGPYSDFDLLVIESDPISKREEAHRLREKVRDLGLSVTVDIRVLGETEFQETKNIIGGIAYPAHSEGLVLYEAA